MHIQVEDYFISNNKELLQFEIIKGFLSRSYWGNRRTEEQIRKSIANSLCYGVYRESKQIGFARVVTDGATMYWLADVYVDEDFRGRGIGKNLISAMTNSDELKNLMGVLGTRDAHQLYEQYGFTADTERMMRRMPSIVNSNA